MDQDRPSNNNGDSNQTLKEKSKHQLIYEYLVYCALVALVLIFCFCFMTCYRWSCTSDTPNPEIHSRRGSHVSTRRVSLETCPNKRSLWFNAQQENPRKIYVQRSVERLSSVEEETADLEEKLSEASKKRLSEASVKGPGEALEMILEETSVEDLGETSVERSSADSEEKPSPSEAFVERLREASEDVEEASNEIPDEASNERPGEESDEGVEDQNISTNDPPDFDQGEGSSERLDDSTVEKPCEAID